MMYIILCMLICGYVLILKIYNQCIHKRYCTLRTMRTNTLSITFKNYVTHNRQPHLLLHPTRDFYLTRTSLRLGTLVWIIVRNKLSVAPPPPPQPELFKHTQHVGQPLPCPPPTNNNMYATGLNECCIPSTSNPYPPPDQVLRRPPVPPRTEMVRKFPLSTPRPADASPESGGLV